LGLVFSTGFLERRSGKMEKHKRRPYDRMSPEEIKQAIRDIFDEPHDHPSRLARVERVLLLAALVMVILAGMIHLAAFWL
jgi:hypothetical protein